MSGGVAYVLDPDGEFDSKVNHGMVSTSRDLDRKDEEMLRRLVENHVAYTDSKRGKTVLDDWEGMKTQFVKVMPDAYADAIAEREEADVRTRPPAQASPASGERHVAEGGAD